MNIIYQLLFVLITTGFFVAGNTITAQWAKTNNHFLWIPIFLFACIGYVLFGLLVKQTNLAIGTGLVDALLVIISILIGILIFKDIVTIQQTIGLILACVALILII